MNQVSIVIAEDDAVIAWYLKMQLEKHQFTNVQLKETGNWMLEKNKDYSIDLIISNLKLSDGWITTDHVESVLNNGARLLIVTGLGDLLLHEGFHVNKAKCSFLFKPFTDRQFTDCIWSLNPV